MGETGPDRADPPPRRGAEQETQRLWRLAGMGGTMASEIVAAALIGLLLDKLFNTWPTLLIILTCLGVVVGLTTFIRGAMAESRQAGEQGRRVAARLWEERRKREEAGQETSAEEDTPRAERDPP